MVRYRELTLHAAYRMDLVVEGTLVVEAHRGSIRCDSVVGEGTEFHLVLPRTVHRRSSHMGTPAEVG